MKWSAVMATLVALNVLLLISLGVVGSAVRTMEEAVGRDTREHLADLEKERQRMSQERIRLATTVAALGRAVTELRETRRPEADPPVVESEPSGASRPSLEEILEAAGIFEKPEPLDLPLLSREEVAAFDAEATKMAGLDFHLLDSGGLEALLGDPGWNPEGQELTQEERRSLGGLLSDYRYFSRYAHLERVKRFVQPVIGELRDAGAFIQYMQEDEPPKVEGAPITHAETSETPGFFRMYFFYPEEHPDMYHFDGVVRQQTVKTAVEIYHLVHG